MNVIALIFIIAFSSGPQSQTRGFEDMDECQAWLDNVPTLIASHNATGTEDKIISFAASCTPVKPAPKGEAL
jgi:hypothetical protein